MDNEIQQQRYRDLRQQGDQFRLAREAMKTKAALPARERSSRLPSLGWFADRLWCRAEAGSARVEGPTAIVDVDLNWTSSK